MCLVFVGRHACPEYPVVVAFNRDEVFCRKTRVAHWWDDAPQVLGGRDLERHGTWAGATRTGRIALLTFVRSAQSGSGIRSHRSRGQIVSEFLSGIESADAFIAGLRSAGAEYLAFNVIVGELCGKLLHYTNVSDTITPLASGVHGLSNATLNTPWPKVRRGREFMEEWIRRDPADLEPLFSLMREKYIFADGELPQSGVSQRRERTLSALFVDEEDYGTRTTTVIRLSQAGQAELIERTHATPGDRPGEVRFRWQIETNQ